MYLYRCIYTYRCMYKYINKAGFRLVSKKNVGGFFNDVEKYKQEHFPISVADLTHANEFLSFLKPILMTVKRFLRHKFYNNGKTNKGNNS